MSAYDLALGPLREFLEDDRVTEIMVNGPETVCIERDGKIVISDARFDDEEHLEATIRTIVESVGREIDDDHPLCDARLADGSRVNAVIPPLAVDWAMLTIRKFKADPLRAADLLRFGSISEEALAVLEAGVLAKSNILVSGGTGTGKTTVLNVLSSFIPDDERIVTIEDAAELQLQQWHVCRLETRPARGSRPAVGIRDLVINSLRMRPDRIVIGECRGPEALDMLQAMNTGHDGSLTTLHANSSRDALGRLETLVLMAGVDLPLRAIRKQMASALDMVVQLTRLRDGSRRVTAITEVIGMEGETITLQDIFLFEATGADENGRIIGQLAPTGNRPEVLHRLEQHGIPVPPALASIFPTGRPAGGEW
jgi:pilus assembly protein CpaF